MAKHKKKHTHPVFPQYAKVLNLIISLIFVAAALYNFYSLYIVHQQVSFSSASFAAEAFYITFFFFTFCFVLLITAAHFRQGMAIVFNLLFATTSLFLAIYPVNHVLQIHLPLATALILCAGTCLDFPANIAGSAFCIAMLVILQLAPDMLGINILTETPHQAQKGTVLVFILTLALTGFFSISIRMLADKVSEKQAMLSYQQQAMTKLTVFNQRLQEHAKDIGEEAAQRERNRISREMHDSAGYVYTNIMALIDAAISGGGQDWSKTEDILYAASIQARDGLQETRKTLRQLRSIEPSIATSIESVYQISRIFGEITGIQVLIETGNIQKDYGEHINKTLYRIVQEALTNSVRHGCATRVDIQFWQTQQTLALIVSDNGIGSKQIIKGIGLAGMEERLDTLGGSIEAYSPEEGGFRLKIFIPLNNHIQVQSTGVL